MNKRKQYINPIVQYYSDTDNTIIYYNYTEDKFYKGKNYEEVWRGSISYYLSIPIAIYLLNVGDKIMMHFNINKIWIMIIGIFVIAITTPFIYEYLCVRGKRINQRNLSLLEPVGKTDALTYWEKGRRQYLIQIKLLALVGLLCIAFMTLFVFYKRSIFLLLYAVIYFILILLIKGFKPIRKHLLFKKSGRM